MNTKEATVALSTDTQKPWNLKFATDIQSLLDDRTFTVRSSHYKLGDIFTESSVGQASAPYVLISMYETSIVVIKDISKSVVVKSDSALVFVDGNQIFTALKQDLCVRALSAILPSAPLAVTNPKRLIPAI